MHCLMVASAFLLLFLRKLRVCIQSSLFVQRDKRLRRLGRSDAGLSFYSSDYFMKLKYSTVCNSMPV